jgi:hypothetical protein
MGRLLPMTREGDARLSCKVSKSRFPLLAAERNGWPEDSECVRESVRESVRDRE